jgi:MFS transporter, ACS family, hexuronate transporter
VAEWFTPRQRALGNAIFSTGSSLGAITAPPLIVFMAMTWGWQSAFLLTGLSGLLWIAIWMPLYRNGPHASVAPAPAPGAAKPKSEFWSLLRHRPVWGLITVRCFTDPVWWFYIAWLPKYMADERGFGMADIGAKLWIPYVTSAFGGLVSGWVTSRLIHAGWTPNRARKTVMTVAGLMMVTGFWVAKVASADLALVLVSVAVFGFYAFSVNTHAVVSDLFPTRVVASVSGISGVGAGVGAIIFTQIVGMTADRFGFGPVFVIAGLMPIVAVVALLVVLGPLKKVDEPGRA